MSGRLDVAAEEARLRESIGLLLIAAEECQWRKPGSLALENDTAERSQGTYSDPTPEIALDERRLALRDAVRHARASLRLPWLFPLEGAEAWLSEALRPYGVEV